MRLHELVAAIAVAVNTRPGRVSVVASRLRDAGVISRCEGSRRYPESVPPDEVALLFIAAMTENNLGTAPTTATTFAELRDVDGTKFAEAVEQMLFNGAPPSDIAIRIEPPSASVQINPNVCVTFGPDAPSAAASARFIPAAEVAVLAAALSKDSKC